MKRLFVAIDIPEPITAQLVQLNPHLPGVRWLKPEQIHLTLSFLGNVGSIAEETLREKLNEVRFTAFFMPVLGLGAFPAKGKPNVIWAGVGTGHPQLFHVYKRVQERRSAPASSRSYAAGIRTSRSPAAATSHWKPSVRS